MNFLIYSLPLLGALIGWGVNKIMIGMFFRRVLPRRKPGLARELGAFAKAEFASFNIEEKISDPSNLIKAMPFVENHVDNFLRHRLKEEMPMVGMFIGDKTIQSMKEIFMKELENLFPEVMKQLAGNMKNELDIEQIVTDKLNALPEGKLEKMLVKELRILVIAGALTGFLIGLLQIILILLVK
jgi:uncharacterized membrane protein YheB (UPF0754 family)